MLKNMRRAPSSASTMSPATVRSPTITSAPIARRVSPASSRDCTTRRLTLPMPPAAPVIRYMALLGAGPDRGRDQVAAVQAASAMLVHLDVLLVGHHVEECRR